MHQLSPNKPQRSTKTWTSRLIALSAVALALFAAAGCSAADEGSPGEERTSEEQQPLVTSAPPCVNGFRCIQWGQGPSGPYCKLCAQF